MSRESLEPVNCVGQLPPRLRRIVPLVVEGMTNKEIALEVGVTEATLKNYLQVVYIRTGMGTRLELALWYLNQ